MEGELENRCRCLHCVNIVMNLFPKILQRIMESSGIPPQSLFNIIHKDFNFKKKMVQADFHTIQTLLTDGYAKLDVTLILKIIAHFSNMFLTPPTRGWASNPQPNEITIGDDAQRLRLTRNHFFHKVEATISEVEYNEFLTKVNDICERMDKNLNLTVGNLLTSLLQSFLVPPWERLPEIENQYKEEQSLKEFLIIDIGNRNFTVYQTGSLKEFMQTLYNSSEIPLSEEVTEPITLTFPEITDLDVVRKVEEDLKDEINRGLVNIKIKRASEGSLILDISVRKTALKNEEDFKQEIELFLKTVLTQEKIPSLGQTTHVVISEDYGFCDDQDDLTDSRSKTGGLKLHLEVKPAILQSEEAFKGEIRHLLGTMAKKKSNGNQIFQSDPVYAVLETDTQFVKSTNPNSTTKDITEDLDDNKKRWIIVGICIHSILSPILRKYIESKITSLYHTLVSSHSLNTQTYPNHYQPTGVRLFYDSINNNQRLYGPQFRNYDMRIFNPVDFAKIHLPSSLAKFTGFDASCDSSALLNLLNNPCLPVFSPALRSSSKRMLAKVRNVWAHCNFDLWISDKYQEAFDIVETLIRDLGLDSLEENTALGELDKLAKNGMFDKNHRFVVYAKVGGNMVSPFIGKGVSPIRGHIGLKFRGHEFLSGTGSSLHLLNEIKNQTSAMAEYVQTLTTETETTKERLKEELNSIQKNLCSIATVVEKKQQTLEYTADTKTKDLEHLHENMATAEYKLVGREDLLQQYYKAWKKGDRIFGFYGMTKVGKTRLCAEFKKYIAKTDDIKIAETSFDFKDSELQTYDDLETLLFLQFDISSMRSSVGREQIVQHANKKPDTKFFFTFESLEEAMHHVQTDDIKVDKFAETLWDQIYQNIVMKFLKSTSNIYFCLTSSTWAKFASWSKVTCLKQIDQLSLEDSVALLRHVVHDQLDDYTCLDSIAELCDGLPGSIINVGTGMLQTTELTNEDTVCILVHRKLDALSGEFLSTEEKMANSLHGMVRMISDERRENLSVIASAQGMSMSVGAQAFDYEKEALFKFDVLIPLKYRSLLHADKKTKDISVHPITQEFMKIHHASMSVKSQEIADKVQKLINKYYDKLDKVHGKQDQQPEYIEELIDYRNQGFPNSFTTTKNNIAVTLDDFQNIESNMPVPPYHAGCIKRVVSSSGNPKLNDLSPAKSTEIDDKNPFMFPSNSNIHSPLEQKPNIKKDINIEFEKTGMLFEKSGLKQKKLRQVQMNLGCSIEDHLSQERRLSEIYKQNNLSRSTSAQEPGIYEIKLKNFDKAMAFQESTTKIKRSTLNSSVALEASEGPLNLDDYCGNSQNMISLEGSSQISNLSASRHSSCERNDVVSLETYVNVSDHLHEPKRSVDPPWKANKQPDSITQGKTTLPLNVTPMTTKSTSFAISKEENDNSLKRLLFGQFSSTSHEKNTKREGVEHSWSSRSNVEPVEENSLSTFGYSQTSNTCIKEFHDKESFELGDKKYNHSDCLGFESLCEDNVSPVSLQSVTDHDLPKFSQLILLDQSQGRQNQEPEQLDIARV